MRRGNSSSPAIVAGLLTLSLALRLGAQPLASQPGLCGPRESGVIAPLGITAVSEGDSGTRVTMQLAKSVTTIEMPAVSKVEQVCRDIAGNLLFFGRLTELSYDVYIVNPVDGAVLDTIRATTPAISPDRRWLAYRAFWPRFSELEPSEEYLLYDLTGDAASNTSSEMDSPSLSERGFVAYPRVASLAPFFHAGLPPRFTHSSRSGALHWSEDSKSLVFADSVEDELSVVLVTMGKTSRDLTSRTLAVARAQVCGDSENWDARAERPYLTLSSVAWTGPELALHFETGFYTCSTRTLRVSEKDFRAAKVEEHAQPPRKEGLPANRN